MKVPIHYRLTLVVYDTFFTFFFIKNDDKWNITGQKMKFSVKVFLGNVNKYADLLTFTTEILNAKVHFLYSGCKN